MNTGGEGITVTILGSGTCVPSLDRSAAAVLMETCGMRLLFDIGPGTMRRLLESGTGIQDIDSLFISHFHPDHTGELAAFLFATKYPDPGRRKKPLTIVGGPGFRSFYEQLVDVYQGWIHLPEICRLVEVDPNDRMPPDGAFNAIDVDFAAVAHRPESLAFRIGTPDGASVVVSGDTAYSENLVRLALKTDLLICEAALPDEFSVEGHMTPSTAGRTAAEAGAGTLVLTHFYPECDHADMAGQCRKTWAGPLLLARDLMQIPVRR